MALSSEVREHLATHKYFDAKFKKAGIKVLPGEYYATKDDLMIPRCSVRVLQCVCMMKALV